MKRTTIILVITFVSIFSWAQSDSTETSKKRLTFSLSLGLSFFGPHHKIVEHFESSSFSEDFFLSDLLEWHNQIPSYQVEIQYELSPKIVLGLSTAKLYNSMVDGVDIYSIDGGIFLGSPNPQNNIYTELQLRTALRKISGTAIIKLSRFHAIQIGPSIGFFKTKSQINGRAGGIFHESAQKTVSSLSGLQIGYTLLRLSKHDSRWSINISYYWFPNVLVGPFSHSSNVPDTSVSPTKIETFTSTLGEIDLNPSALNTCIAFKF